MSFLNYLPLCIILLFSINTFAQSNLKSKARLAPDYHNLDFWASHPAKVDSADAVPAQSDLINLQEFVDVDVFFIHPTTLMKNSKKNWNAFLDNHKLNKKTDKTTIKYQASIFNESCKVYAPRYRQAHYRSYKAITKDNKNPKVKKAFEMAYADVKAAFQHYLENYNNGRPIVIASHSQGTTHSMKLLKEFFDGKPLQELLVTAYVVGMPIQANMYTALKPCENASETGCINSWCTYEWRGKPKYEEYYKGAIATNPINWTIDGTYASCEDSKGMVIRPFKKVKPKLMDAQSKTEDGIIWVHKPDIPGKILMMSKNYHIGDFNLFYQDVRENVALRIEKYFQSINIAHGNK